MSPNSELNILTSVQLSTVLSGSPGRTLASRYYEYHHVECVALQHRESNQTRRLTDERIDARKTVWAAVERNWSQLSEVDEGSCMWFAPPRPDRHQRAQP